MFSYITVEFPLAVNQPKIVYAVEWKQNRYEHEMLTITFKDWDVNYDSITTTSPVTVTIRGTKTERVFNGYVHHVKPNITPGKNFVEVGVISPSYLMKQQNQTVYKNITADQVVKKIAKKYGFACYTVPHPRVYKQISQAGRTDWELMVRLAKQCGYTLRTQNTELYFQPVLEDYTKYRTEAPYFELRMPESTVGTTIYSFNPVISESVNYDDAFKAAVAVAGVDTYSKSAIRTAKQKRNKKTRSKQKEEVFDRFATDVVVNDPEIAKYEAEAAENRNSFPYRAYVEVLGEPNLRTDLPVFLEGLGDNYSGYWTILGTEHNIVETELNQQTYTTTLYIGTDSLGSAVKWTDNNVIQNPNSLPKRTIIPNVKQTKIVPQTTLINKIPAPTPQTKREVGLVKNRAAINERVADAPVWKSQTASLNELSTETRMSPAVVSRLQRSGVL